MPDFVQTDVEQPSAIPKPRTLIGIYILIFLVLIVLVAILAVLLWQSGVIRFGNGGTPQISTLSNEYEWQKTCDAQCAQVVGDTAMAQINVSGCADLSMAKALMQSMLEVDHLPNGSDNQGHPQENLQAVNDKMSYSHCNAAPTTDPATAGAALEQQLYKAPDEAAIQRLRDSVGIPVSK